MSRIFLLAIPSLLALAGCQKDAGSDTAIEADTSAEFDADGYEFQSAFSGESSVSYSGQVFRQLLIDEKAWRATRRPCRGLGLMLACHVFALGPCPASEQV